MSVSLRLSLIGKKGQPHYRIIATETRSKRDGKYVDLVGLYNPSVKPPIIKIDQNKLDKWLSQGAIVTPAVQKLIKKAKS